MQKTIDSKGVNVGGTENAGLENVAHGTSQFGIVVILTLAALVGLWGAACLIGGIARSGNLVELGRGFVTAVFGV